MNIEAILMFVFIAVISSLFGKKTPKRGRSSRPQVHSSRDNGKVPAEKRLPEKRFTQKRDVYTYDEMDEVKAKYDHIKEKIKPKEYDGSLTDYKHSNKGLQVIDINTMELEKGAGFDGNLLSFTPNSIIQGIIMAEILDKPKSMRR